MLVATEAVVVEGANYKSGMRKNLKISFTTIEMADKAFSNCFSIGDYRIQARSIMKEDYVYIPQCYRCFSYDHLLKSCPAKEPRCSICSGSHLYRDCPTPKDPKCCVCGQPHIAVSAQCPFRREAVKKKKASVKSSAAEAAPLPSLPTPAPLPTVNPWNPLPQNPNPQPLLPLPQPSAPAPPPGPQPTFNPNPQPLLSLPLHHPSAPAPLDPQPTFTTAPAPPAPQPLQPSSETPAIDPKNFTLYLGIWQNIASRMAGSDHLLYIKIYNSFLKEYDLPELRIPQFVRDLAVNLNNSQSPLSAAAQQPTPTPPTPVLPTTLIPISPLPQSPPQPTPLQYPIQPVLTSPNHFLPEEPEECGDSDDSAEFSDAADSPHPHRVQVLTPPELPSSQTPSEVISASAVEEEMAQQIPIRSSARTGTRNKETGTNTASRGRSRSNHNKRV